MNNIVRCDDFEFENKTIVCKTLALKFVMFSVVVTQQSMFARFINAIKNIVICWTLVFYCLFVNCLCCLAICKAACFCVTSEDYKVLICRVFIISRVELVGYKACYRKSIQNTFITTRFSWIYAWLLCYISSDWINGN